MEQKSHKSLQFKLFINEIYERIYKQFTFDSTTPRVNQLYGEQKEMAKASLVILEKYKKKFHDVRDGDITALFAEKNDRESMGSSSYAKHMRPNMIREFEQSYKTLSNYLKTDVFQLPHLPIIQNNGMIKYKGEKKEKEEQKEEQKQEIKKEIKKEIKHLPKGNDAWSDEPFISPFLYKVHFPSTNETILI